MTISARGKAIRHRLDGDAHRGSIATRSFCCGSRRRARDDEDLAVALGVDRKAVSYHVGDRESLLALMASTVFTSEFARVPAPTHGDWRDVLGWYAHTIRRALTQLGIHDVFPLQGAIGSTALKQAEFVLESLVEAGFDARSRPAARPIPSSNSPYLLHAIPCCAPGKATTRSMKRPSAPWAAPTVPTSRC